MHRFYIKWLIGLFLGCFLSAAYNIPVYSQFYNGLRMDFGKNRVQYNDFYWNFYRFERFDMYFHSQSKELSEYASRVVKQNISQMEHFLDYPLENRIIFIVYSKLTNFRQSNIGLVSSSDQNIGGVTKIIDNKVFLYYTGDIKEFEQQIQGAIAEVIISEMFYGGNFRDRMASSALLELPEWYVKGLISFISKDWNIDIENKVRDGILNGNYEDLNNLTGMDAIYAGHSIWKFIAEAYGESIIPNIIYMSKINRNYDSGFLFVLGVSLNYLTIEWIEHYNQKFKNTKKRNIPDIAPIEKRPKRNHVYHEIKISPDKKHIAYVTNKKGKYKVWVYNTETGKKHRILKRGHALEQIPDYSFPILAWHPTGELLAIITEVRGSILLSNYYVETKQLVSRALFDNSKSRRKLFYYDKILDFSYSQSGLKFVFSAVQDGQTDIYVYNITANASERITTDMANDFHPRFINNDEQIVFCSNRMNDTLTYSKKTTWDMQLSETYDLFVYDYKNRSNVLQRITTTPYINETQPYAISENTYTYLSDQNGIRNRQIARYDSVISHIDTTIHYRYFSTTQMLTNYRQNIEEHHCQIKDAVATGEIIYHDDRYYSYFNNTPITARKVVDQDSIITTNYLKKRIKQLQVQDSLRVLQKKRKQEQLKNIKKTKKQIDTISPPPKYHPDSILVNINRYIFEAERVNPKKQKQRLDSIKQQIALKDTFSLPTQRIYQTSFYRNYVATQVDFSFLHTSYQKFTGGAVYFNPGANMFTKFGVQDLFEDYKITGGFRLSANVESNEFILSVEDLKNRMDKQYLFHRQTFTTISDNMQTPEIKVLTHELMYILRFPFSQVTALKGTASLRYDRSIYKSTNFTSLNEDDEYKVWGGLKLEYIFDNTVNRGLNLYNGTRYKIFGEYYQQVDGSYNDLYVIGADFRHYQKLHRSLILATRFAASTSFGSNRLIYYLGSVDNWIPLSRDVPKFIPLSENPINEKHTYAYQALASNMRGFSQNIRNGNSFALINAEIRWPVFQYLLNRPLNSDLLNNMQLVGFFDVGSAWSGTSPLSDENAYNRIVIENNPITITIDREKSPLVAGFGAGVRSKILGYFVRLDWAWGIENNTILPRIFYLSLDLDF